MLVDVRPALVSLLNSNASIAAIVAGRIFPMRLMQGMTLDSIVYNRISEVENMTMIRPDGLISARYQFDAWSQTAENATVLANLIKEQFGGFAGRVTLDVVNYVDVQLIEIASGRDEYDNEAQMYNVSKDYFVIYEERNA